jgi:hemoglobin
MESVPTLYEWIGGMPVIESVFTRFYEKVLQDELLEPVFRHMSPSHQLHVAHFIAEVFGGPALYSQQDGSHFGMIQKHLGKHLTELHRQRWATLLVETADELKVPADPEFRSAFVAYIEWGTRIAVMNSQETEIAMGQDEPMPRWGWGEVKGPYKP